ncbi:hypothetical protein F2P56_034854 [Juglans regia]|uniref:non-specific serine/threonine protein kinase n=2 Tax=Juglans regia TaxID=51240 RepID=A0A2I4G3S1_JUGRE|nr:probable serine/threonine-protein kinase At1g01540 [Juglans regia]KAF5442165.1 hypothetical protein F2P56_034854 [Juglans regia]
MSFTDIVTRKLSKHTSFFGLPLLVLIVSLIAFFLVLIVSILSLYFVFCRRRKSYKGSNFCLTIPVPSKHRHYDSHSMSSLDRRLLSRHIHESEMSNRRYLEHHAAFSDDMEKVAMYLPGAKEVWRPGSRFSLRDIEMATNGLAKANVIGSGDYGAVYRGILLDNTPVAVKKLVSLSCKAEGFIAEMEAFGQVRHKNLVNLVGYCSEGTYRMLVYEYVDNGNLFQWLHENPEKVSPLTWSVRVKIIRGIAKGLAYLHEDLEPKVIHRCLKSSNILLDHKWNPKITDFGLAMLFGPEWSRMIMETLGYIAPEYDSTYAFTEKNDVYSFGILVMEVISGRTPVDSRHDPQPYLIEWLKSMVANHKVDCVLDPKLKEMPSSKELKRIILVALRCVDPNINDRPKMGDVLHMLEPCDMLLNDDLGRIMRETSCCNHPEESLAVSVSGGSVGSPNTTNKGGESSFQKLPFDDHFGNYHSDDHHGGHQ